MILMLLSEQALYPLILAVSKVAALTMVAIQVPLLLAMLHHQRL
jgi:hypothetical protein